MILACEILFATLVIADMVLTHRIIKSGKGVEIGIVAKHYISSRTAAIVITAVVVALIIGILRLVDHWLVYLCAYGTAYYRMGRVVLINWRVLYGR
jgi:ABC-type amino acid transport system permease subunit